MPDSSRPKSAHVIGTQICTDVPLGTIINQRGPAIMKQQVSVGQDTHAAGDDKAGSLRKGPYRDAHPDRHLAPPFVALPAMPLRRRG